MYFMNTTISMSLNKSLDQIIGDFNASEQTAASSMKLGGHITVVVPSEYKDRYNRIQQVSRRRFAKKLRELVLAAIDIAEAQAS